MSEKELRIGFEGNEQAKKATWKDGKPEPWDLATKFDVVGKDHIRVDAIAKVTGQAKFAYDIRFKDLIYARFLRSPHAHATVKRVDVSRAKLLPGVLFTEAYEGARIRYAGQEVAGIAAESEEILDDALRLIEVEYEVSAPVVTVEDARKEGAPKVVKSGNVSQGRGGRRGNEEKVAKLHGQADKVVEAEYRTQVQTHSCLETHGCVCKWEGDKLTVWATTQGTFAFKGTMARALGIPAKNVTVITEHMGGGFGSKFGTSSWDVFCARAARETGRPCRYLLGRRAEHMVAGNRPDSIQKCKFSANNDGTVMGAEVRVWGTGGIGGGARAYNPGIYAFKETYSDQYDVKTHAGGARAFRAPGHPQGIFALEGMMDELAEAVGMDPLEFRKKNDPNPVRLAQYDIGAKEIGWSRRKPNGSSKNAVRRGIGMASARWGHNGRPGAAVHCRVGRDGSVLVANGAQDLGTGTRTWMAIVAAEVLGLQPSDIEVRLGNTNDPVGPASGGSVTTPSLSPVVHEAVDRAKKEILQAVARAVGGDPEGMDLEGGGVVGIKKPISFQKACALLPTETIETSGRGEPADFLFPQFTREVAGVQFAEVEVDTRTGRVKVIKIVAVQDCGRVLDALTTRSQINGGVIQGLSYALFEERHLDRRSGNMVNADFLGYKIAGALDMPEIVPIPFTVSHGKNSTGASSLGEPPTVPTAGAIANAVANALGVRIRSIPITPDKVLAAVGGVS